MDDVRARPRRTVLRVEKKPGDAPRAALRSALGYLIMPLWGGGNEKPGEEGHATGSKSDACGR
jgi:hypothetical protein